MRAQGKIHVIMWFAGLCRVRQMLLKLLQITRNHFLQGKMDVGVQVCFDGVSYAECLTTPTPALGTPGHHTPSHHPIAPSPRGARTPAATASVDAAPVDTAVDGGEPAAAGGGGAVASGGHSLGARMRMMNAIGRVIGLHVVARRRLLQQQLDKLRELRTEVIRKLDTKQAKDGLMELRKYRRPPRAAAQVRCNLCGCHSSILHSLVCSVLACVLQAAAHGINYLVLKCMS